MIFQQEHSPVSLAENALKAGMLSRTVLRRKEAKANFTEAFELAVTSAKSQTPLTAKLYGQYSEIAMGNPNKGDWLKRFTENKRVEKADEILANTYRQMEKKGALTIEILAQLFDNLMINHFLVDGNKRASILALTHLLSQYGYQPPDFSSVDHDTLEQLQQQFPGNHLQATVELLRNCVGTIALR